MYGRRGAPAPMLDQPLFRLPNFFHPLKILNTQISNFEPTLAGEAALQTASVTVASESSTHRRGTLISVSGIG